MNNLMERYIYDVIRRLPENIRDEVKKELDANIRDMLPENPSESDIYQALTSLGDPALFAEQYRARPRYLISPSLFDDYIKTLKLVAVIAGIVFIVLGVISTTTELTQNDTSVGIFVKLFVSIITGGFSAVSNAFLWVTLAFAAVDYFNLKQNIKNEWTPASLPLLPAPVKARISRGEAIADMVFSILFTVLFVRFPHLFGWFEAGDEVSFTPIFNEEAISRFVPVFLFVMVLSLILAAIKLVFGHWNYPAAGWNLIVKIVSAIFTVIFITTPNLVNEAFLRRISQVMEMEMSLISSSAEKGLRVFIILVVVFTLVDIVSAFYKAFRNQQTIK